MSIRIRSPFHKVNILTILEYLLMILIVLYTSMWCRFLSAESNAFLRLAYPLLIVMIALRLRQHPIRRADGQRLILLAVFLAGFIICSRYNLTRFVLYYIGPILLLTLYLALADERDALFGLWFKLSDIMTVLTVISLICFVFGTCLDILPGAKLVSYEWANGIRTCTTYYHLYYEAQNMLFFGHNFVRNCGMFTEAPGFAIFLVMGTATEVFLRPRIRWTRCIIYALASVTSFSTKAILLVILIFGLKFLITERRSLVMWRLKMLMIPAVLLVLAGAAIFLLKDKMNTSSFFIRVDDLRAGILTFVKSPLFGVGYFNSDPIVANFHYSRPNDGLSMGVVVLLAQGGLYLTTLYVLPVIALLRRLRGQALRNMLAFFLVFYSLMFVTNMPFMFITMFALAFALEYRTKQPTLAPAADHPIQPAD